MRLLNETIHRHFVPSKHVSSQLISRSPADAMQVNEIPSQTPVDATRARAAWSHVGQPRLQVCAASLLSLHHCQHRTVPYTRERRKRSSSDSHTHFSTICTRIRKLVRMQRIDPRPVETPAQQQAQQDAAQQGNNANASSRTQFGLPTGFASTGREAHTQSFEEIYGVPENFLEIEV